MCYQSQRQSCFPVGQMCAHVHSECTTSNNRLNCHPCRRVTKLDSILLLSSQGTNRQKRLFKLHIFPLFCRHISPQFLSFCHIICGTMQIYLRDTATLMSGIYNSLISSNNHSKSLRTANGVWQRQRGFCRWRIGQAHEAPHCEILLRYRGDTCLVISHQSRSEQAE